LDLTVEQMHLALVEGLVTPRELTLEAITRAKADKCNCFEATNFDEALKEASAITEVKEDEIFKGIPYLVKDNYSTAGLETTASSNILNGYIPTFDAEVVARLKKAGAIILAKTTLDELAMGGTGTSGHKGVTSNPYDKDRIIGGSSCGSCAGVASGIAPFALGSDTGDSVRKPAGYGGLYGFKPTWSRISRFGLFPFAPSLDAVGYFARNVKDIALLTELLSGHDEKDMSSSYRPVEKYTDYLNKPNAKKVIGYFQPVIEATEDKKIVASFNKCLEGLKKQGYQVVSYDFPLDLLNALYPTYMVISCSEATSNDANLDGVKFGLKPDPTAKTWEEYMSDARTRGFSSLIKRRFIIGSFSLLAENQSELFRRAQKARRLICEAMEKFFASCDYLLLPCAKSLPPYIKDVSDRWNPKPNFVDNHLGLANLGGYPSLTCPLGYEQNLPYGINITSRQFEEGHVLALGQDIENLTGLTNQTVSHHQEGI
jgi:aspartyl-tRNA(Asn)/glutamyl-tRNA(Gln) amidotransferase subunit A